MKNGRRNQNYYLQRRLDREMEKSIDAIVRKKMKEYEAGKMVKSSIERHNRQAFYDFKNTIFRDNIKQIDVASSFGSTQSQFLNTFASELQTSIFRHFF
ncbi:MAG: hypothetical protein ACK5WS_01580 [Alphaproteobacteria bacterium]|jgi:hypothetical protein|nr:hypothetical protein [Candidatus Jidaibacter sp.]